MWEANVEQKEAASEATRRRFLHGDLDLIIFQARRLPNMDLFSSRISRCFSASSSCASSRSHRQRHPTVITSDPYVTVCIAGARVARTRVISNSQNPVWEERFKIPLAHQASEIHFYVKDNDLFGADLIGVATVPLHPFLSSNSPRSKCLISEWLPIIGPNGKPPKADCALRVEMKFRPCDEIPLYQKGIGFDYNAQNTYFPVRHGGKLTLYQDAHVSDGCLPEIELEKEGGREELVYKQGKCWEEICEAIVEAHHLVYIVGWSVYHKVRLVREGTKRELRECGEMSLGELLRYKSQEGVRVLLLVWDDKTSHSNFFIHTAGVMQTHDEETRKFFKHSSVKCVLSPRYGSSKLSIFKQQVVGTLYTHHQKCVIVDSQAPGNNRKITAFIGGLDLCDGRYDTPEHRLFQDLDTVFKDDYHNPTFPAGTRGPRQPWHDMHCKIEGPAAYDVLLNFEQRWRKASKWKEFGRRFKKVSRWRDDALIKLERISWIISPSTSVSNDDQRLWASKEEDPENWHIQVFRSIDSGSLKGFPKDAHQAEAQNLVCAKDLVIDKSIQTAYIQAIRCAQRFIYIENQYFIGSSYAWPSYKDAGAENSIPMELALKICSKIRAGERFAVYIVIPMWPEGVPTSASVQEVLFWQGETMKMMYQVIANELMSLNLENAHPLDYLNFYCLGSRQELPEEMQDSFRGVNGDTVADSQKNQRFMVYVHAKGMIVDDEYVLMGSANINQRSMAGSRDTEIAMGAYQPNHTWANKKRRPRGQVYGYRMSLWAEHLGMLDDLFKEPETLDCVRAVNRIAQDNWNKYLADEFVKLQGHLLAYPVQVDSCGKVSPMPRVETFPDVGGKVLGARTTLPDALTT